MDNYNNDKFSTEDFNAQAIPEAAQDPIREENPIRSVTAFVPPPVVPVTQSAQIPPEPKPKKKRAAPIIALMLAVAIIGSGSGFLTVILTRDYTQNQYSANGGNVGTRLPENTTAVNIETEAPSFLVNNNGIAEVNDTDMYTFDELYNAVKESVVAIKVSYSYRYGREIVQESSIVGSGVVFTTDGYVLTNHHVIEDCDEIWVVVTDNDTDPDSAKEYEAEIVGSDKESDIAVLKINRNENFAIVPIGDSASLKVGQQISAIGYPLGLERTMTTGIVSGLNRVVYPTGGYELSSIQVTAAVNPGNSGGPLFDMYGNVVGIVNKKLVYETIENIGFAISIDEAKPIINDLMEYGKITSRPVLGITGWELNAQMAEMYGFTGVESGVLVQGITPTAPVAQSGLAVGDIIIKINKTKIEGITDIQSATKNLRAGDTVEVTVLRFDQFKNSVEETVTVELSSAN